MDKAKPGHTVEFTGLKGAAHLNGTEGTLVEFLKKEQRWSVRCELDRKKVNAKPENLILRRNISSHPIIGGTYTPAKAAKLFGSGGTPGGLPTGPVAPNSWAKGLCLEDQYEWFSNCYQMRCDDDYSWGGGDLHGPYDPEATPQSIADDFLIYCLLAHRSQVVPSGWDWPDFLKSAANFVSFAFEKSDAMERWGSESGFEAQMGGRSLRYTGIEIYKSPVDQPGDSREYSDAENEARTNKAAVQNQVGGAKAWVSFVECLGRSRRFA